MFRNNQTTAHDVFYGLFSGYSDFRRLLRTVAWLLRFVQFLKAKYLPGQKAVHTGLLDNEDIERSQVFILKAVQKQAFPEVFLFLYDHKDFNSPLHPVTEKQNRKGILRFAVCSHFTYT